MTALRITLAVAGLAALLLAAGCGGGGPIGAATVEQHARSLESGAAEGALLADDAASGRMTATFVREHSSALAEAVAGVESALNESEAEPTVEDERRRLVAIAVEVTADLERLDDAAAAEQRMLAAELRAAAAESERIGASLG